MDTVLNTIIILFWSAFFLATVLSLFMAVRHSFRKPQPKDPFLPTESQTI